MKWTGDSEELTIHLAGEIDHYAAEKLRREIESLIKANRPQTLVLNFQEVSFMDSSGIGMLIGRYKTMLAQGGKVYACCLSSSVSRLYRMAGLHRIIPLVSADGRKEA